MDKKCLESRARLFGSATEGCNRSPLEGELSETEGVVLWVISETKINK